MASKTFTAMIVRNERSCYIPLTFDPKAVFGKIRAPVRVTLNDEPGLPEFGETEVSVGTR